MKKHPLWLFNPPVDGYKSILIIRLLTGSVFVSEGIIKFVFPNQGVGRFTKLGFPFPEFTGHFAGAAEIIGGLLLIFGLLTRATALFFLIEMVIATLSTKIGLYMGTSPLPPPPVPPISGMWAVLHEVQSEYAQQLTSLFLIIAGPGVLSLDNYFRKQRTSFNTNLQPSPKY